MYTQIVKRILLKENKMKQIMFGFSIVVLSLVFIACEGSGQKEVPNPTVQVYETKAEVVTIYSDFVGQVYGQKDIAILARVEGFLEGIHFLEGRFIKKGKLLYSIESASYESDVAAMMSRVAEAKTMLAKYESDLNRTRPLAESNAVSQSDLDAAVANYEASIASVEAAEAGLKAAKIYLSYTKVSSPISGIIGKTKAKVGDFVGKSPNPVILNTVSSIDTIHVEFFITENQYLTVMRNLVKKYPEFASEGFVNPTKLEPTLSLILADGTIHPEMGKVKFIDREIDPTTGAILIQAEFPNSLKVLRPGLFAKVRSELYTEPEGILIPQRCIMELQGRHSVYVVTAENKIENRTVIADEKVGSMWLIEEGLKAGEKVVYEGLQKVRPGMEVNAVLAQINSNTKEIKE